MNVIILYGSESGNAELVADDLAEALADRYEVQVRDMSDADPAELASGRFTLVVCSTHGEGELPSGAVPFMAALERDRPDLRGLSYAVFGLGDSSYDVYSRGSELVDERLRALGAERVGPYGRHDASSRDVASDLAILWAEAALKEAAARDPES